MRRAGAVNPQRFRTGASGLLDDINAVLGEEEAAATWMRSERPLADHQPGQVPGLK
jgi:hypothetical protein